MQSRTLKQDFRNFSNIAREEETALVTFHNGMNVIEILTGVFECHNNVHLNFIQVNKY